MPAISVSRRTKRSTQWNGGGIAVKRPTDIIDSAIIVGREPHRGQRVDHPIEIGDDHQETPKGEPNEQCTSHSPVGYPNTHSAVFRSRSRSALMLRGCRLGEQDWRGCAALNLGNSHATWPWRPLSSAVNT